MRESNSPKFVVIGGGTGSFTLLSGLKHYTNDITALVTMVDSGGSTGQLRDEYGVLPPGDVRQCLVALSNSSQEMRELFNFRFGEGSFEGHSFGNLFLAAVEKMTNDFADAIRLASEVLNITGRVVPMTLDNVQLVLKDGDAEVVGEHEIEKRVFSEGVKPEFTLRPHAWINPEARQAILDADMIVLAPGSLYESLVASLIVDGAAEALQQTKARIVQICNLVTKPGQTDGWCVADFVKEMERFVGEGTIHYVLYNTAQPTEEMLTQYAREGEYPVSFTPEDFSDVTFKPIGRDLVSLFQEAPDPNDKLAIERTLIRHDPDALARALMRIYFS